MKKKILLVAIIIIFWASVCAVLYFINNPIGDKIDWDMTGVFITDGGAEEAITVSIDGKIVKDKYGSRTLHGNIDFPEEFRYILGDTDGAMPYVDNQEHDYFPHLMIFIGSIYSAQQNAPTKLTLALDMEKGYAIALMGDAPNCYLVASRDPNTDSQQLLTHFKDFIDSEAERFWS